MSLFQLQISSTGSALLNKITLQLCKQGSLFTKLIFLSSITVFILVFVLVIFTLVLVYLTLLYITPFCNIYHLFLVVFFIIHWSYILSYVIVLIMLYRQSCFVNYYPYFQLSRKSHANYLQLTTGLILPKLFV